MGENKKKKQSGFIFKLVAVVIAVAIAFALR
jgi:hypothetical protein